MGCYKENKDNLAMEHIFHNEADPDKPNFAGNMLEFSDKYEADFPEFLCKCARQALIKGWEYFGVRELGEEQFQKSTTPNEMSNLINPFFNSVVSSGSQADFPSVNRRYHCHRCHHWSLSRP